MKWFLSRSLKMELFNSGQLTCSVEARSAVHLMLTFDTNKSASGLDCAVTTPPENAYLLT